MILPSAWALYPRCACGGPLMLSAEHPRDEEFPHPLVCLACSRCVDGTTEELDRAATAALARIRMLVRQERWVTRAARRMVCERMMGRPYAGRATRRQRQIRFKFLTTEKGSL